MPAGRRASGARIDAGMSAAPNEAPLLGTVFNAIARKSSGEPYRGPLERLDTVEGDLDAECKHYEALMHRFGGIDLQLLGIGKSCILSHGPEVSPVHARINSPRIRKFSRKSEVPEIIKILQVRGCIDHLRIYP